MWDGYESRRWRVYVRPRILRRDGYRCREARRYGRNVEASVVHHIWPAEDWPEYAWADWNLLSLSAEAHRAMHNDDGSLSALGESWRRRTIPPHPLRLKIFALDHWRRPHFRQRTKISRGGKIRHSGETETRTSARAAPVNDAPARMDRRR